MTNENNKISEADVLLSTSIWLLKNNWDIQTISPPNGQLIHPRDQKEFYLHYWQTEFLSIPENLNFQINGPDIIATQGTIKWKIECKGLSDATSQTIRNNFDRALASCVTYFDHNVNVKLGLAVPSYYEDHIRKRLPLALRVALKMSIFLYSTSDQTVSHFDSNYNF